MLVPIRMTPQWITLSLILLQLCACSACKTPSTGKRMGNEKISSFRAAKAQLRLIYADHRQTLYCGCSFDQELNIGLDDCAYNPTKASKRAKRVEWEHVVPARILGQNSKAWKKGHPSCHKKNGRAYKGRRCAKKTDANYRRMAADLYNLYPSVGAINNARGSLAMGEVEGEQRRFGQCDFEIGQKRVEPTEQVRGEIARTYLYMHQSYPRAQILSDEEIKQYEHWALQDPPDTWECQRAQRIKLVQGNANPIVEDACIVP